MSHATPPAPDAPDVQVVAALVWRGPTLLAAQRRASGRCANLWEFPGGKCEPGESGPQALVREAEEELGVALQLGPLAWHVRHQPAPGEPALALRFYHAVVAGSAEPRPLCSQRVRWASPAELAELPFCPADGPLLRALVQGEVSAWAPGAKAGAGRAGNRAPARVERTG